MRVQSVITREIIHRHKTIGVLLIKEGTVAFVCIVEIQWM